MITLAGLLQHLKLANTTVEAFVRERRKDARIKKIGNLYSVVFNQKFYHNVQEKLMQQEKPAHKIPSLTEDGAWLNAALHLLNLREIDKDEEIQEDAISYALSLPTPRHRAFAFALMSHPDCWKANPTQMIRGESKPPLFNFGLDGNEAAGIRAKIAELNEPDFNSINYQPRKEIPIAKKIYPPKRFHKRAGGNTR